MRREYLRQIASVEASGTADTDFFIGSQAPDSTSSGPSMEGGIQAPSFPAQASSRSRPLMPTWLAYVTAATAVITLLAAAILYVGNMKGEIATNAAVIKNLEKSHDSLRDLIRHEVSRVETNVDKRLAEMLAYLRGEPAAKSRKQAGGSPK